MNFKKFISGISALTIAASAFAAMAVTASAAVGDPAITGTYSDGKFAWTITGHADATELTSREFTTLSGTATNPEDNTDNVVLTFVTGSDRNNSGSINRWDGLVDGGIYIARQTASGAANVDKRYVMVTPSKTGTLTFDMSGTRIYGSRNDYTSYLYVNDVTGTTSPYAVTMDNLIHSQATYGGSFTKTGLTYTMVGGHSYVFTLIGGAQQNNAITLSNFTYEDAQNEVAGGLTINFMTAANEKVADMTVDTTGTFANNDFTYYVPAYVEGTDGKLYATTANYSRTTTLAATDKAVDETVTLYTGLVHQFVDFNNTAINDNGKDIKPEYFSSGAAKTGSSGENVEALTVAEDGIYTIKVRGGDFATDNARNGELRVNGVNKGAVTYTNYGGTINTFENIKLHKNDVISVTIGRGASSALDYVLIEKTGDISESSAVTADETFTNDDGDGAATYRFYVTPNDETVTSITVTATGATGEASQTIDTPVTSGSGSIYCAIIATFKTTAPEASAFSVSIN